MDKKEALARMALILLVSVITACGAAEHPGTTADIASDNVGIFVSVPPEESEGVEKAEEKNGKEPEGEKETEEKEENEPEGEKETEEKEENEPEGEKEMEEKEENESEGEKGMKEKEGNEPEGGKEMEEGKQVAENPTGEAGKEAADMGTGVVPEQDFFENAVCCTKNMKIGWNLGNSLDSTGSWIDKSDPKNFETAWGNPVITKGLIRSVKESGFYAVRVPVTYVEKMDKKGEIDGKWLARVKEVVDDVLAEGMYCIINVHHDTGAGEEAWLRADSGMYKNGMDEKYSYLWEQIAGYFKDYDEKLLFESFNEILDKNSNWGGSDEESYDTVNNLNQLFVDTVRESGGNNRYRNLIVNTYGASSADSQVSGFQLPKDTVSGHLIAEVHIYDPSKFCNGEKDQWEASDEKVLSEIFERLNEKIVVGQEVPVIVGEFGAQDKFGTEEYTAERAKYASCFVKTAKKYGITCFWWDDGGSMKLFDRAGEKPYSEPVIEALVSAAED